MGAWHRLGMGQPSPSNDGVRRRVTWTMDMNKDDMRAYSGPQVRKPDGRVIEQQCSPHL